MDKKRKSLEQISINYSLKCGFILILLFQVAYLRGLNDLGIVKYMNLPIIFYVIYRSTRYYKIRHNYCELTYEKSVLSGVYITTFSLVIVAIYTVLFYKYIDPESLNLVIQNQYLQPEIPKVARAYNFLRPYGVSFLLCFIYTLLISLVLKKKERSH